MSLFDNLKNNTNNEEKAIEVITKILAVFHKKRIHEDIGICE